MKLRAWNLPCGGGIELPAFLVARCVFSLAVLALCAVASFLVVRHQAELAGQNVRLVNLSGRQRMLVSRTAHEAERLLQSTNHGRPENPNTLRDLTNQLEQTHVALLRGDPKLDVPPPSSAVKRILLGEPYLLHEGMRSYLEALKRVADHYDDPPGSDARETPAITVAPGTSPEERRPPAVGVESFPSATNPGAGLAGLETLVGTIQREGEQRLGGLLITSVLLLLANVFTLVLVAFWVFRPLIRQVEFETAQLESARKASDSRARQLESAVAELEARRDEDDRRARAMLNIMNDLRNERVQLRREASIRERAERQFRGVVEAAPNAMIMIDQAGRIVLVNAAAEAVFQYRRSELLGQPIELLIPEKPRAEQLAEGFDLFSDSRATLIGEGRERFGRRKDKSEFVVEIGMNPIESDDGMFTLMSVVDMTAHKEAFESTARLAAIVESSNDAIIGQTLDGTIISWNRGAEQMYGYSSSEAVGRAISILVPPDRDEGPADILTKVASGELVDNCETVRRRQDGSLLNVALTASPIADKDGTVVGASIIARDITERKRAERKLEQYASDLERSNRELEQFAYVASHDLKEPLRMVASFTNLLAEEYGGKLGAEADKYIAYATDGARRMSALIDDLLNYSRVGRDDAPFDETVLQEVVKCAIEDLQPRIAESKAVVEVAEGLPVVRGNRSRLGQLFQNLICNALKFRHPDRDPVVRIDSRRRGKMWELTVRDNGIGVDPEYHERIFQVFQRLHSVDEYPGTGIGLAVCKKIVEHHGGRVRVESNPDLKQGTAFLITLPVWQPSAGAAIAKSDNARHQDLEACSA